MFVENNTRQELRNQVNALSNQQKDVYSQANSVNAVNNLTFSQVSAINALTNSADDKTKVKHTVKDSVFTDLFSYIRYVHMLYEALHPEDKTITEKDIRIVTLENIFVNDLYNDLGFMAGNKLIVFVEAQSTWSENILVRGLLYIAKTISEYIEEKDLNVYASTKIDLPEPEFYVIFTGKRTQKPAVIKLSTEIFGKEDTSLELKAKVIYDGRKGDIIYQYVNFCRVYNEQLQENGRNREAVQKTIQICKDSDYLKEYLISREKEVENMLIDLYNKEKIMKAYLKEAVAEAVAEAVTEAVAEEKAKAAEAVAKEKAKAAEAVAEEKAKAAEAVAKMADEAEEKDKATALALKEVGMEETKIAAIIRRNVDVVKQWLVASVL